MRVIKKNKRLHLDTSLFMHRNAEKPLREIEQLLSEIDVDALTQDEILRLTKFMGGITMQGFFKEFIVETYDSVVELSIAEFTEMLQAIEER